METSVISAYFDFWRVAPKQKKLTRQFWNKILPKYQGIISKAVGIELNNARAEWAKEFRKLIKPFTVLLANKKSMKLANKYVKAGVIPKGYKEDAIHFPILVKPEYFLDNN